MTTPSAANTALAEELLPCARMPLCESLLYEGHARADCPAAYRPAVALALQSKDDSAALEIASRDARIAELEGQLPEGMRHCTILFKECEFGHGHLTATNWVQHPCPTCERNKRDKEIARLRAALEPFAGISGGLAGSIIGKMARHSISVLNTPDYPEASAEVELTKQIMDAVPKARAALQAGEPS